MKQITAKEARAISAAAITGTEQIKLLSFTGAIYKAIENTAKLGKLTLHYNMPNVQSRPNEENIEKFFKQLENDGFSVVRNREYLTLTW